MRRRVTGLAGSIMLGRAIAPLHPAPRRWVQRLWGTPDIHARQKWAVLWPQLASLPPAGVRLLDAGCGTGAWSLELATRRPAWHVTGVDRSEADVRSATDAAARLGVRNVEFACADFLAYAPSAPVDVVLAVASAHYLAELGRGDELFRAFAAWLAPGGRLCLFGPRRAAEVPRLSHLPPPFRLRDVFSREALESLCRGSGLVVERLVPRIGRLGTYAKQVRSGAGPSRALAAATYPLQLSLTMLDEWGRDDAERPSSAWLLVARRRGAVAVGAG